MQANEMRGGTRHDGRKPPARGVRRVRASGLVSGLTAPTASHLVLGGRAAGTTTLLVAALLMLTACANPVATTEPATTEPATTEPVTTEPDCEPDGSQLAATGSPSASALELPEPTGPHRVGTTRVELTDEDREDPLSETATARELIAQVWYPTDSQPGDCVFARYQAAPEAAANEQAFLYPAGSLDAIVTPALLNAPIADADSGYPVVLYSNGLYGALTDNTAIALQLASVGYVVVATSTTYESPAVAMADDRVLATSPEVEELLQADVVTPLIQLRVDDASFVLDQLASEGAFPETLRQAVDLTTVGMFGHSAGGAASLQLARDEADVQAAVNLDGFARQAQPEAGLDKPFLFVTSDGHTAATEPTWPPFLEASNDGTIVEIAHAGHLALTDVGSDGWIDAFGLEETAPPEAFATNFGDLEPGAQAVIVEGVTAFFDQTLRDDEDAPGFEQLHATRPEIVKSVTPAP